MCPSLSSLCGYNHGNEVKQMAYIRDRVPWRVRRDDLPDSILARRATPAKNTNLPGHIFFFLLWSMERFTLVLMPCVCVHNTDSWFLFLLKESFQSHKSHTIFILFPFFCDCLCVGYKTSGLGFYWNRLTRPSC